MPIERVETFSGYVLAGGRSSRMGTDKALLPFRESNLLHHALETLSAPLGKPCKAVISPPKSEIYRKMLPATALVTDMFADMGALGGIHAALADCGTEFAFVLAVDLPLVTPTAVLSLIASTSESDSFDALVPEQDDGRLQPLCGIYRRSSCLTVLERLFQTRSDSSVRDLLARVRTVVVPRSQISDDETIFRNINDRGSYESLFAR